MAGKLSGNGLFESSRMMLPEHKEALISYAERQKIRMRMELDEQELQQISGMLQSSLQLRMPLEIKMYDPLEDLNVIGIVERIDQQLKRFKVDGEWFMLNDIEHTVLCGEWN